MRDGVTSKEHTSGSRLEGWDCMEGLLDEKAARVSHGVDLYRAV
jgi:hypothetical protein